MYKCHYLLLAAFVFLISHVTAQGSSDQTLGDLFNYTLDNNNGGCGYVGEATLQSLVRDARRVVGKGYDFFRDYDNPNEVATRLIEAFFSNDGKEYLSPLRLQRIMTNFMVVRNWLRNSGAHNDGRNTGKPWLHCDHDYHIKKTWQDLDLGNDGEVMLDKNGNQLRIEQVDSFKKQRTKAAKIFGVLENAIFPYWSDLHKVYLFDKEFGSGPSSGYCDLPSAMGMTFHMDTYSVVLLCPQSFGLDRADKESASWTYVGPRLQRDPTTASVKDINNGVIGDTMSLGELRPNVQTFLHELFHLVLGSSKTSPAPPLEEIYDLTDLLNAPYNVAVRNAESYARMALGAYNTVEAKGAWLEWFTGYATDRD